MTTIDSSLLLLTDTVMDVFVVTAYTKAKVHRIREATRLTGHFSDVFYGKYIGYIKDSDLFVSPPALGCNGP